MVVLRVTPAKNVLITKRCFKSENPDYFYSKIVQDGVKVEVYDIVEHRNKLLDVSELNAIKHRMIINNKKFFICSMTAAR